jgi:hypothetical protein
MKEKFFGKLETLIAEARRLKTSGFDEQEPEGWKPTGWQDASPPITIAPGALSNPRCA